MNLDAVFKAYDIRGKVGSELTPELAYNVGRALADFLLADGAIAVGRDMRPESAELAEQLIKGLTVQGRNVVDIGLVTSDMSYWAVGKYNLAGSAMITASHNPGSDNGIKLYRDQVVAIGLGAGLEVIRDNIKNDQFKPAAPRPGGVEQKNISADFIKHCLEFIKGTKLPKFSLAIDAGNGMAGAILPGLQAELPFKVTELFYELDGSFPNHPPNPRDPANLSTLINTIKDKALDFGIAFDGDGDRMVLVDDLGRIVDGSDVITMIARDYLEQFPGSPIVYDVRASRGTEELIREWGGQPVRTVAGRVNIGTKMRELNAPFGGETTGHLFFRDNYFADSGIIGMLAAIKALAKSGQKLSELADQYRRYQAMPEVNFEVGDKQAVLDRLAEVYKDGQPEQVDGLSVNYPDWWFNIRPSNTENLLRLNIEANTGLLLQEKLKELKEVING